MTIRPVSVLQLALAAGLITAVNLSLLMWAVRQRTSAALNERTETWTTRTAPLEPAPQGHVP